MNTKFAPAERYSSAHVEEDFESISNNYCSQYFNCFPLPLLVLNDKRQVVFSNQVFLEMIGIKDTHDFIGRRPGEILNCVYSNLEPGGCGTSGYCSECGAVISVLESINENRPSTHDCQVIQSIDGEAKALDLRVHAAPFEVNAINYYAVTIMDIADEKKREVMERVFFHDILNSAGNAKSLANFLISKGDSRTQESMVLLNMALYGLVEEIKSQQELMQAESGDINIRPIALQSLSIVKSISEEFRSHQLTIDKVIQVKTLSENVELETDYSILRRILINMIKNALEAIGTGEKVTVGCHIKDGSCVFQVHNNSVMAPSVQKQVFKRSFSTKGKGRGLGTYSIKLLAENYLGGNVSFVSNNEVGTIFSVALKI